jgi:cobalt-zinc-cadmium efflux system outer membrane protein
MGTWLAPLLLVFAAPAAPKMAAVEPAPIPLGPALLEDPLLRVLAGEALEKRPELAQVRAQIRAEQERVPQASTLPDPTLALGIQNDGFSSIQIGKMETSYVSIMASQTFPWAGKRGLRGEVVGLGKREAEADLQRVLLSVAADVDRAYVDLLLVRDQIRLLAKLESLWLQSEGITRIRYESGEAAQSDLLRAQLQRNRLRQQRWALVAEEQRRIAVLNRLRGHPLTDPIATTRTLADVPDPALPDPEQSVQAALAASPELKKAMLAGEQADRRVALASRERWPDVTVNAGIMPRGNNFPVMWQAGVAINLPIWSAQKQSRVMAENRARGESARDGAEAIRQLLSQRVHERLAVLGSLIEANRLYRGGLLVQSEATVASTLAQYRVGRVTFASVLEALAGYLSDLNGFLDSVATTQKIVIAEQEISLDAPGSSASAMASTAMPGAGATATSSPSGRSAGSAQDGDGASASMSKM